MWELLGLLGVLALWAATGLVSASALLIVTRGRAPLTVLPLALGAGIAAGALVPAFGAKDGLGFGISLLAAITAASAITLGMLGRLELRRWLQR